MGSRAIITTFIIISLSINLCSAEYVLKKRDTTQNRQDSSQSKKHKTNKNTKNKTQSTKSISKSKKIQPLIVESGLSKTTIITLSTIGGVALASGIGVGVYYRR